MSIKTTLLKYKKIIKDNLYARLFKYLIHNIFSMKTQQIIKKERNISKYFLGKTYGFTLVELIIVITILAILATLAIISFKNYSWNARDGNRIATVKNLQTGLNLYQIKTWNYPLPNGEILTGTINE